tara:strand:- start:5757 stop:7031 length:1275 start_codon:yes stop_codon:yes gene_type:complete
MRYSKSGIQTIKDKPIDAEVISHQLLVRAGMIKKLASGLYTWMPLGLKVLKKVENIIIKEMDNMGCLQILMPAIQPSELWEESGRWDKYGKELLRIKDRHDREFCFGPTHEEVISDIIRKDIKSYKQLPLTYYQIQTKFRDEVRPRFGIMRAREFMMKDAYSFHTNEKCLNDMYDQMFVSYKKILETVNLEFKVVMASTGQIGGSESHEFHVIAENGEDELVFSDSSEYAINSELSDKKLKEGDKSPDGKGVIKIKRGIEVGHIFKLGKKYSEAMGVTITSEENKIKNIIMGCYGIGVSRIVAAAIEQCNDERGIIWPTSISPYDLVIIPINYHKDNKVKEFADDLYHQLSGSGISILLDDRNISPGAMFSDADLIGIPKHIIIGKKFNENKVVELKERKNGNLSEIVANNLNDVVDNLLNSNE